MPSKSGAVIDPFAASTPLIFSPEGTSGVQGRPTSTVKFQVWSPTSNAIRYEVKIYPESDTINAVALLWDGISEKKNTTLQYLGDGVSPHQQIVGGELIDFHFRSNGFLSGTWNGKYKGIEGKSGYAPDGVYHFVVRIQDAVGAMSEYRASVIKGKVVPKIDSLGGEAVISRNWGAAPVSPTSDAGDGPSLVLDAKDAGASLSITGRAVYPAPEGKGFIAYRLALIPTAASADFKGDTLNWTYLPIQVPGLYTAAGDPTRMPQQVNGGLLGSLPLGDLPNGRYDLALVIEGTRLISLVDGILEVLLLIFDL
jgi:hypothetical protein